MSTDCNGRSVSEQLLYWKDLLDGDKGGEDV